MANCVARYRGGGGHHSDLECAYPDLEWYLVLSCNERADCPQRQGQVADAGLVEGRDVILDVAWTQNSVRQDGSVIVVARKADQ
jgi:hypothetical protein